MRKKPNAAPHDHAHGPVQGPERRHRLSMWRAGQLAAQSLRLRLGRSALTLVTIMMATAFLTDVWAARVFNPAVQAAAAIASGAGAATAPAPGAAGRTIWLLTLSLLVCLTGIANAMLMSVMERFREIGTMKCLGAPDRFILAMYFLESLMLGAAGTVVGVVMGLLLAAWTAEYSYSGGTWRQLPWEQGWAIAAASAGIGLAITAAAALYPAWKAARMEPIAAMRVEA